MGSTWNLVFHISLFLEELNFFMFVMLLMASVSWNPLLFSSVNDDLCTFTIWSTDEVFKQDEMIVQKGKKVALNF